MAGLDLTVLWFIVYWYVRILTFHSPAPVYARPELVLIDRVCVYSDNYRPKYMRNTLFLIGWNEHC